MCVVWCVVLRVKLSCVNLTRIRLILNCDVDWENQASIYIQLELQLLYFIVLFITFILATKQHVQHLDLIMPTGSLSYIQSYSIKADKEPG